MNHLARIVGNKRLKEVTNDDLGGYVTVRLAGYSFKDEKGKEVKLKGVGAWSINEELQLWGRFSEEPNYGIGWPRTTSP